MLLLTILLLVVAVITAVFAAIGPLAPTTVDAIPQKWAWIGRGLFGFLSTYGWVVVGLLLILAGFSQRAPLLILYRKMLAFALRPVLPVAGGPSIDLPYEIKSGEFQFALPNGQAQRSGDFTFARPFREMPHVYIAEGGAGNWLLVKIDRKDAKGFTWAVRRALDIPGPYKVRLQWVAFAPNFSAPPPADGQLVIHSARYGQDDVFADLTLDLRARVKNGSLEEVCGNHLGGDPYLNVPKSLTIEYSHQGQKVSKTVAENDPIKLP
jgi:hypothetical protein